MTGHIEAQAANPEALKLLLGTLRLLCRIFYSLNWQDLPEYFEDNMASFMTVFLKYLQYTNPALCDDDEEDEPGPIEKVQAAICDNINLYVEKYEAEFAATYLSPFATGALYCCW